MIGLSILQLLEILLKILSYFLLKLLCFFRAKIFITLNQTDIVGMLLSEFFNLVLGIVYDFVSEGEVERDQILILFPDDFFVAGDHV